MPPPEPDEATPRPGSRRQARKRALDILYEADLLGRGVAGVLADHLERDDAPDDFAVALVRGVERARAQLDALISDHARGWRLERMPVVDRNLLRIGLYEILHDPDVPAAVAITEAVELAKELSTEDSGRFLNGVLAHIAGERAPGQQAPADQPTEVQGPEERAPADPPAEDQAPEG
jgi:transcription antitermination protein NusB